MLYDPNENGFVPWQPSTWPPPPAQWSDEFASYFHAIVNKSIVEELDNVISDVSNSSGSLAFRGHVIAIGLLCAVDTVSSYAYQGAAKPPCPACGKGEKIGARYQNFIAEHFPPDYRPYAEELYGLYRNSVVHSWHLFRAAITPGKEPIQKNGDALSFGLLHFHQALKASVVDFFGKLQHEAALQQSVIQRYAALQSSAG